MVLSEQCKGIIVHRVLFLHCNNLDSSAPVGVRGIFTSVQLSGKVKSAVSRSVVSRSEVSRSRQEEGKEREQE